VVALAKVRHHVQKVLLPCLDLHDLPLHKALERRRHDLRDLGVLQAGEHDGRTREEVVARDDRHLVGVELMDRFAAAAGVRLVEHVVVDERRDVDHLGDLPEERLLLVHRPGEVVRRVRRSRLRHEHHNRGPEALPLALREEVLRRLGEYGVVGRDHVLDAFGERRELVTHDRKRVFGAARREPSTRSPRRELRCVRHDRLLDDAVEVLRKARERSARPRLVEGVLEEPHAVRVLTVQKLVTKRPSNTIDHLGGCCAQAKQGPRRPATLSCCGGPPELRHHQRAERARTPDRRHSNAQRNPHICPSRTLAPRADCLSAPAQQRTPQLDPV
jgi:hypothetical protein